MNTELYQEVFKLQETAREEVHALEAEMKAHYSKYELRIYRNAKRSKKRLSEFFKQPYNNWCTFGCDNEPKGSRDYLMSLHLRHEKADRLWCSTFDVLDGVRKYTN